MADGRWLPEELLMGILLYLPAKSLMRFRCVSTQWCSFIKSPCSVTAHHQRCKDQVLISRRLPDEDIVWSIHDIIEDEDGAVLLNLQPNLLLPVPFWKDASVYNDQFFDVLGPSHGVVCFFTPFQGSVVDVILANPGLKEFKRLPRHNFVAPEGYTLYYNQVGFGFDPDTNGFKVVLLEYTRPDDNYGTAGSRWASLYHSSTNSWSLISDDLQVPLGGVVHVGPNRTFFLNGACHWNAESCIFSFDIRSETFGYLEWPVDAFKRYLVHMAVLNDCLAVVLYHYQDMHIEPQHISLQIWVMKEYGVKDSWTKLCVIGPCLLGRPLVFLKNEWLLVENREGQLQAFSLQSDETKVFPSVQGTRYMLRALSYKESLISLFAPPVRN